MKGVRNENTVYEHYETIYNGLNMREFYEEELVRLFEKWNSSEFEEKKIFTYIKKYEQQ